MSGFGASLSASHFFFHCHGLVTPYTGGCVSVCESVMKLIMQKVKPGCKITIDKADKLGVDFSQMRDYNTDMDV